ncbi:hypothetical protein TUBRATIS_004340 [Tubulinosema ratisbonensis]|uniref:Uncharacterized protein n=1 Tax=Tubulinosema ratisbonensis TaxID=291195 RepID=A0A437APW4_9MICR|nr:hypothetical protein TUBRATIS_004340 [Tubulinosema ratisbonensis]
MKLMSLKIFFTLIWFSLTQTTVTSFKENLIKMFNNLEKPLFASTESYYSADSKHYKMIINFIRNEYLTQNKEEQSEVIESFFKKNVKTPSSNNSNLKRAIQDLVFLTNVIRFVQKLAIKSTDFFHCNQIYIGKLGKKLKKLKKNLPFLQKNPEHFKEKKNEIILLVDSINEFCKVYPESNFTVMIEKIKTAWNEWVKIDSEELLVLPVDNFYRERILMLFNNNTYFYKSFLNYQVEVSVKRFVNEFVLVEP